MTVEIEMQETDLLIKKEQLKNVQLQNALLEKRIEVFDREHRKPTAEELAEAERLSNTDRVPLMPFPIVDTTTDAPSN